MPVFKKVNKHFFKKWSPEMAYVLGFFAADGTMTVNKNGGHYWVIEIQDKELIETIREIIKSDHKIGVRLKGEVNTHSKMYRLQIGNREMYHDLYKLGMKGNKTHNLSIPNVPEEYFADFVRGYFDGDGNVWSGLMHKGRNTQSLTIQTAFTSCSLRFLKILDQRLQAVGINKGAIYSREERYFRLVYSVKGSLKLYDFMYNNKVKVFKPIFLQRKKKVFDKFIKQRLDNAVVV